MREIAGVRYDFVSGDVAAASIDAAPDASIRISASRVVQSLHPEEVAVVCRLIPRAVVPERDHDAIGIATEVTLQWCRQSTWTIDFRVEEIVDAGEETSASRQDAEADGETHLRRTVRLEFDLEDRRIRSRERIVHSPEQESTRLASAGECSDCCWIKLSSVCCLHETDRFDPRFDSGNRRADPNISVDDRRDETRVTWHVKLAKE